MNKPTKPTNDLPSSFGGDKENFSASKIQNGYEPDVPDILGGANLNYMLDTLGKKQDYYDAIVDFIRDIPIAKTITVDANDNLVYRDWLGGRNFGELVYSAIPLSDSGLKLLDGSVLSYTGVYKNFIDYIDSIYDTYSSIFVTEQVWQQNIANYGVCGKFVYDSVNKTVRLPKVTGIIEGTVDVNALGDIVLSGLPSHFHSGTTESSDKAHTHDAGTMSITGSINLRTASESNNTIPTSVQHSGVFKTSTQMNGDATDASLRYHADRTKTDIIRFNASKSQGTWSGNTSSTSIAHTHIFTTGNPNNSIYGRSSTVQPQTIKCFIYMCVSTSIIKSDDVIQIDEIVSMINGKADIDGSDMVGNLSSGAKSYFTKLSLPSTTNTSIVIPASGNTITAPSDGYICCTEDIKLANNTRYLYGTNMPVISGDSITVTYDSVDANSEIIFVYAQGGI